MPKGKKQADGTTIFGPYKGSKENGGRKIMVIKKGQKTTSTNAARHQKEKTLGKKLPRTTHVDHKDGNKENNAGDNLQTMSRAKNIGKGNKERRKK